MEMARKMSEMIALDSNRRSSLPPRVNGNLSGYLIVKISEITWHQKPLCPVKVYVCWWGDTQTATFYPSDKQLRVKSSEEDTTYVYNVLTSIKLFESYLKDCEALILTVHDKITDVVLGRAEVKKLCILIKENSHHSWYAVSNENGDVIADLHAYFSLKIFPCAYKKFIQKKNVPQIIPEKEAKKIKSKAANKNEEMNSKHAEPKQSLHFNSPRVVISSKSVTSEPQHQENTVSRCVGDNGVSNEMISQLLEESQNIRKDLQHLHFSKSLEKDRDYFVERRKTPDKDIGRNQSLPQETKVLNYILGKEMTEEEEAEAIEALKGTSPINSLMEFANGYPKDSTVNTNENRVGLKEKSRFCMPQMQLSVFEESKTLLKELKDMKNKMEREISTEHLSETKQGDTYSKDVYLRAKFLRISVQMLSLNYVGVQRVFLTSQTSSSFQRSRSHCNKLPPGVVYFVEYEIPFCLISQACVEAKKKPWQTQLHRFCSRQKFGKCINFFQHKVHVLACTKPGFYQLLTSCCITFKVYSRCLNQRVPALLGEALLSLAEIIDSSTLSKVVELSVLPLRSAPRTELSLGTLKVKIEFGSNRLFCEPNINKATTSQLGSSSSESESESEEEGPKDSRDIHLLRSKSQVIAGVRRPSATLAERSNRGFLKTDRNRNSTEESKKKYGDNKSVEARSTETSYEKRTLLYGLLHIPKGRGMQVDSTYLVCRAFWKEDVMTSDVCWGTGDPLYSFHEVMPVLLSLDLLDRCYNNFMVTEVWSKTGLVGIAKMPLNQFYIAYRDPAVVDQLVLSKYPIVGVDGWVNVVNPLSRRPVGQLNVLLAMGTESQIQMLEITRCLKDDLRPPPMPPSLAMGPETQNATFRNVKWPEDPVLTCGREVGDFSKEPLDNLFKRKEPDFNTYGVSAKHAQPVLTSSESFSNNVIPESVPPKDTNKTMSGTYHCSTYQQSSAESSPREIFHSYPPQVQSDSTSSEAASPRKDLPAPQLPRKRWEGRIQDICRNTHDESNYRKDLLDRGRHGEDVAIDYHSEENLSYLTDKDFERCCTSSNKMGDEKGDSFSREPCYPRTVRLCDLSTVEEDEAEYVLSPDGASFQTKLRESLRRADTFLGNEHGGGDSARHISLERPSSVEIGSSSSPREISVQKIDSAVHKKQTNEFDERNHAEQHSEKSAKLHEILPQNDGICSSNVRQDFEKKTRVELMKNDEETSQILDLLQELNVDHRNKDVTVDRDSLHMYNERDNTNETNIEYDAVSSPTKSQTSGKSNSSSPCAVLSMNKSYQKSLQQREDSLKSTSSTNVFVQTEDNALLSTSHCVGKFLALVEVSGAMHLPEVAKNQPPSCYVTLPAINNMLFSPVAKNSCNPVWHWNCETWLPVSLLQNVSKRLILKVWHKMDFSYREINPVQDLVIGFVPIDLTLLLLGLPCIKGWFNICDFSGHCKGQIELSVTPMEDLSQFKKDPEKPGKLRKKHDDHDVMSKGGFVRPSVDISRQKNHQVLQSYSPANMETKGYGSLSGKSSQSVTINCHSQSYKEDEFSVARNQGRTRSEEYMTGQLQDASLSFLSRTLKQKLSELDEITQRMRNRVEASSEPWLLHEPCGSSSTENGVVADHSWGGGGITQNQPTFQPDCNSDFQKKISEVLQGVGQRNVREEELARSLAQSRHGSSENMSVRNVGARTGEGSCQMSVRNVGARTGEGSCQEIPSINPRSALNENVSPEVMASTEKIMNDALKEMELENVFNPLLFQHILSCYQNGQQLKKALNQCTSVLSVKDPVQPLGRSLDESTFSQATRNSLAESYNQNCRDSSSKRMVSRNPERSSSSEGVRLHSGSGRDLAMNSSDKKASSLSLHYSDTSLNSSGDRLPDERENSHTIPFGVQGHNAARHSGESTNTASSPSTSFVSGRNYDLVRSTPSGISTEGGDLEFLDGRLVNICDRTEPVQEDKFAGEVSNVALKVGPEESDDSASSSDTYVVDVRRQAPDGGDPSEDKTSGKYKLSVPSKMKKSSGHGKGTDVEGHWTKEYPSRLQDDDVKRLIKIFHSQEK